MRLQYQQEAGGKWHDVPIVDEILTPPLEPIPDYGDLMTKEEWLSGCEAGAFIDYDGFGNLATADGVYAERIFPSQAKNYNFPKWVTHIVWYNR